MAGCDQQDHRSVIRKALRIAFVLYALLLTTVTHWPRLQFPAGAPGNDKTTHLLAFAMLTLLLWQTRWLHSLWSVIGIAAVWAIVDEGTQGIPALGRTVSMYDLLANLAGVTIAAIIIKAAQPTGGLPTTIRKRACRFVWKRLWKEPRYRKVIIRRGALVLIAGLLLTALFGWLSFELLPPTPGRLFVIVALLIVITAAVFSVRQWAIALFAADVLRDRPCFNCSRTCNDVEFDDSGWACCPNCGGILHNGQWIARPMLSRDAANIVVRRMIPPYLLAMVAVEAVAIAVVLTIGAGITMVPLLLIVPPVIAYMILLWLWNRRLEHRWDRQFVTCRECEYDLSGTPCPHGVGVCPECGTPFAKMIDRERDAFLHDQRAQQCASVHTEAG